MENFIYHTKVFGLYGIGKGKLCSLKDMYISKIFVGRMKEKDQSSSML
jgi:hypothetical protein